MIDTLKSKFTAITRIVFFGSLLVLYAWTFTQSETNRFPCERSSSVECPGKEFIKCPENKSIECPHNTEEKQ